MELQHVSLLRAAWIVGTLPILVASIPSSRLGFFHGVLLEFAKRGKIMQSSSSSHVQIDRLEWGHKKQIGAVTTTASVGSAVAWTTILLLATWFYSYKIAPLGSESLHYSMVASHLTGVEVLNFAADQMAEFSVKGQDVMSIIVFDWWGYVKPITKLGWCQWTGGAIFVWGWVHQHRCHTILGSLRQHREQTDEYVIPHGDWFEIVSSSHYLAEMIRYAGLLVASGGTDLTMWLLFICVVANLVLAAAETQGWYLCKFEDYPHNRWAILPLVY